MSGMNAESPIERKFRHLQGELETAASGAVIGALLLGVSPFRDAEFSVYAVVGSACAVAAWFWLARGDKGRSRTRDA